MERAAGFAHDDAALAKLDKLDAVLAQSYTPRQDAALFAEMLSLPNDGRYPTAELAPQQRRQKTLEALNAQLEALSRTKPVLMIFEDVHWIDPTSLEALGRAVDRIRTLGASLIVTYRPEFEPPWIGQPHVTALTINRLGQREIASLIARVAGNKRLPASIRLDIIERTDGIPLFVEEMTKAVVEAEGEQAAERAVAVIPSPTVAVPASLHASLMARLDRLGSAKDVAQIGAVIGREFSHALLAAVAHKPQAELHSALDRLIGAGLLFRQGVPPHATYLFKHGLVQDAAYGTLLREPRRALHARIAETLETQFADVAENHPELLAGHCAGAGLVEKAALLWGKAGQRSLSRSALVEATAHLTRALDQIAVLPPTPALRREQINLQVTLLSTLGNAKGFSAPETKAALEQARLLIEQTEAVGEPPLRFFSVLLGLWVTNYAAFNGDVLRDLAAQFLAFAEKQRATVPLMTGHRLMALSLMYTGAVVESRAHYDKAIGLYDPVKHRPLAARFNQDVRVATLCHRSMALWLLGYPDAAVADANQSLSEAREIGHAVTLMYALSQTVLPFILSGEHGAANVLGDELVTLAEEKGSPFWKAAGRIMRGWSRAITSSPSEAAHELTVGLAEWRSTGSTNSMPIVLSVLARAYVDMRQFDEAWHCINEAMTIVETTKEVLYEAEVNRLAGEIALLSRGTANAEPYFERALLVARQQQAKSWELRAAMSLARLWRSQGKPQQARELLAPVYGWFTEGFDTLDLKQAKALLEELAA